MKKNWTLTQEGFDSLLQWLSSDRETAGLEYESIRKRLVKLFLIRGCVNPETLADETINRVISKLPDLQNSFTGNPIHYFYGVANKVHLESTSAQRKKEEQLDPIKHRGYFVGAQADPDGEDPVFLFLRDCLKEIPQDNRDLILGYFAADKAKAEYRRSLAEKAGINLNTLRIKVLRTKKKLEECISAKRTQNEMKRSVNNTHL